MAEYSLTAGTVPANTGYPADVQGLLELLTGYLSVLTPSDLKTYIVSNSTPLASDQDKVWFQTQSLADSSPKSIRIFADGAWKEFTQFSFGDIVLVSSSAVVASPWGIGGTTYTVDGISKLTPTTPEPPIGLKYKVYVGQYA
jgi:hypothetical protein